MKTFRLISYFCFLSLVFAVSSCSKHENADVLSTIPAESAYVLRLNAKTILENAGCTYDSDGWHAGSALEALLSQSTSSARTDFENILKLLPAVESQSFYVFGYNNNFYATCALLDRDAVASALAGELGSPKRHNGFDIYEGNVALRGNQLWYTTDVDVLGKTITEAAESSVLSVKQMSALQECGAKTALTAVINNRILAASLPYITGGLGYLSKYQNSFDVYEFSLDGPAMKGCGVRYDLEGAMLSIDPLMDKISTSFAAQMPANAILAFAFGKPSQEYINGLLDGLGAYGMANVEQVRPYLEACTGTVSVSVAPPSDFKRLLNWQDWRFTATVQYEKDKAQELISMAAPLKEMNFAMSYVNDMLVLTNTRPDERKASYVDVFDCNAGFIAELDPKGDIVTGLGLPFGFKIEAMAKGETSEIMLTLEGSDAPMLESIIKLASDTRLQRRIMANFMQLEK